MKMELREAVVLSDREMELVEAGGCVTGKTNAFITGFCTVGSFLNPFVAGGCGAYGVYQLFACP